LLQKRRVQIAQSPILLLATFDRCSEIHVETLDALVPSLWTNVRRIIHDGSEHRRRYTFHRAVVGNDSGVVFGVNVHGPDIARRTFPEPARVIGGVQDRFGVDRRIEGQHRLKQFAVASFPYTAERFVLPGSFGRRSVAPQQRLLAYFVAQSAISAAASHFVIFGRPMSGTPERLDELYRGDALLPRPSLMDPRDP